MHPQDSRVIAYFSLSLVTRIHMSYVKILLSILFGRICNDNTEERKKSGELHPATFPDTMQTTQ